VAIARFSVPDSAHWLVCRGRTADAEKAIERLLKRRPRYPTSVSLGHLAERAASRAKGGYAALFSRENRKATVLASVPWFLQDLSTYGIGIFTPTILAAVIGAESQSNSLSDVIHNDMLATRGSAIMNVLFVIGILFAILLVDKVGRIRLQSVGFVGCAVGLVLAALSIRSDGSNTMVLLFAGFMLFYFMTNLGPNSMTYLLAGEVYPTAVRGKGAGFAASFAKIGAVLTAFLFPVLLQGIGTGMLLYILAGASLVGAAVTVIFAIETNELKLERRGDPDYERHVDDKREADAALV
jgi:MFS family permease